MKNLKSIKNKFKVLILIFILFPISLIAQEEFRNSPPEIIKLFNESQSYYSINDEIINGCVYPLPNSKINGHPYLNGQWTGAIFFVNNKKYTNLLIKYDLTIDDIILKAEIENGIQKLINVNKFQIDSFIIGKSLFVNSHILYLERNFDAVQSLTLSVNEISVRVSSRVMTSEEKKHTYLEQVYKGKCSLYKEYKKIFIKEYNNITPYGKYSSIRTNLYFYNNAELINVDRRSLFIRCFEKEKQNEIKSFMKKNNIIYKKASQQQLKELMNYCSTLISN